MATDPMPPGRVLSCTSADNTPMHRVFQKAQFEILGAMDLFPKEDWMRDLKVDVLCRGVHRLLHWHIGTLYVGVCDASTEKDEWAVWVSSSPSHGIGWGGGWGA